MLFSSLTFLYFFIPAVLLAYVAVPAGFKNAVLFISSLLFYFFGEPVYVLLLIFSSLSDYLHGLYIEKHRGEKKAKYALISSIKNTAADRNQLFHLPDNELFHRCL